MWRLIAPIAFFCTSLSSNIEDLSQVICKNATAGDIIPNTQDCSSYFICDKVPLIRFCNVGLHFDAKYKVCNWPDLAKCQIMQDQPKLAFVALASKAELNNERIFPEQPPPVRPQISFTAFEIHTRRPIDPMAYYDPENVACHHYGIYFLPHPYDCRAYYICAFGHMLQHKCGRAAGWNYKRQMCDIRPFTECFNGTSFPKRATQISEEPAQTAELFYGQLTDTTADNNGIAGPLIWMPQPTTDTTPNWTFTDQHLTSAAASYPGTVKTESIQVPNCPKDVDAYLPHGEDCTKYYICIIGMPVLTSCPKGLYWDQRSEVCDLSAKVDCP